MNVQETISKGLNICENEECNNITRTTDNNTRFYAFCDICRIEYNLDLLENAKGEELINFCKKQIKTILEGIKC